MDRLKTKVMKPFRRVSIASDIDAPPHRKRLGELAQDPARIIG
jgi:hypothetical protein